MILSTSKPLDELSSLSGMRLRPVLARSADVSQLIKQHLGVGGDTITELVARSAEDSVELLDEIEDQSGELADEAHAASVIRLVNELIVEALAQPRQRRAHRTNRKRPRRACGSTDCCKRSRYLPRSINSMPRSSRV
ncbi:MAG: hypothetical protein R3C10_19080 [Pirellulales bacterium]